MSTEYHLKGFVTFDEYLECHKILASKRRLWLRSISIVYGVGLLIYGAFSARARFDSALMSVGGTFIAYALIISPIQFRYRVKRNWEQYPRMRRGFDVTILPDGVQVMDDKGNPSHTSWESFLRFSEHKSFFLLYLSPRLPLFLPKRLVAEEDIDGLRAILSKSLGR